MSRPPMEIRSADALRAEIDAGHAITARVLHHVDLSDIDSLEDVDLDGALFLNCAFRDHEQRAMVERRGALVFPSLGNLPFEPYRGSLYTAAELLEGYDEGGYTATRDFRIYAHFDRARNSNFGPSVRESLAERLHDHAIDHELQRFVARHTNRAVVGIMGGHNMSRRDPYYARVVRLGRELTREGYLVATGGGPGIMEAGNLGAYLANFDSPDVVDATLEILAQAPTYSGGKAEGTPEYLTGIREFLRVGWEAREALASPEFAARFGRRGDPGQSLAIPTWFYGHEPTNLFCDNVAKYFSNGIREDILLAISRGGVVFAPGSAGTLQEVFMDLAQNHYATFVDRSPMVFLGSERFHDVYDLIRGFVQRRDMEEAYGDLIAMFDDEHDVVAFLKDNPPRRRPPHVPLYDLV